MQPFSILLGLGVLLGLLLTIWRVSENEVSRSLEAALWVLLAGLVGSRVVSVWINFPYYQHHPGEIIQVWQGGLSGMGALIGGVLMIIGLAFLWKVPAGKLADTLLPLAGALAITSWLGCWVDGCGYGFPSDRWWALPGRDEWGVTVNRVPVQLVGATLILILVWLLDWVRKWVSIPGVMAAIGLFGISAVLLFLSFLRGDPSLTWNHLRLETWGAIGWMIFSLFYLVVLLLRWKIQKKKQTPVETVL